MKKLFLIIATLTIAAQTMAMSTPDAGQPPLDYVFKRYEDYQHNAQLAARQRSKKGLNITNFTCSAAGYNAAGFDAKNGNTAFYDASFATLLESIDTKDFKKALEQNLLNLEKIDHSYVHFFFCYHAGYNLYKVHQKSQAQESATETK